MKLIDFEVFSVLMAEIHHKAFDESIARLSYSKARLLSLLIFDTTGETVSYKSLTNYVCAILEERPDKVNPTLLTLGILSNYLLCNDGKGEHREAGLQRCADWYKYRSKVLAAFG